MERTKYLLNRSWFRKNSSAVSINSLLNQAKWLREIYESEFNNLIDGIGTLSGFDRKRRVPKLRYRAGRLIYLSTNDSLASLFPIADELPELHSHAKIMETIASGSIDRLLPLGSNAAQAAAQPLMAATKCATTTLVNFSAAEEQALAVFLINGVQVNRQNSESNKESNKEESELIRFATSGVDSALMRSSDPFIQEIACLHGITDQPRHPELLETIFDEDENLAMDAIDQFQQSLSP